MIIRHPKADEYPEIKKLNYVAYRANWGDDRSDEKIIQDLLEEHPNDLDAYLSQHYFAVTEDNDLMAKVYVNPLEAFYNQKAIKLAGVGGVATYAEYRRSGAIRGLMEQSIRDMYKRDYLLSYLYPFNHAFYRKFGFESHSPYTIYRLDLKSYTLRRAALDGSWHMLKSKDDPRWQDAMNVYNTYAQDMTLMIKRNADRWTSYQEKNPFEGQYFSYIFYNESGEASAYFSYESQNEDSHFRIQDLAFTTVQGLEAILDFARRFRSDFSTVSLPLATGYPLESIVSDVAEEEKREGMIRVVNAEAILEVLPFPYLTSDQNVFIQIDDPLIPENRGPFLLQLHADTGSIQITRLAEGSRISMVDASLHLDIQAFSQLIVGERSFSDLRLVDRVRFEGREELLELLFPKRLNKQNDFY